MSGWCLREGAESPEPGISMGSVSRVCLFSSLNCTYYSVSVNFGGILLLYVCVMCARVPGDQKRVLDSLELRL